MAPTTNTGGDLVDLGNSTPDPGDLVVDLGNRTPDPGDLVDVGNRTQGNLAGLSKPRSGDLTGPAECCWAPQPVTLSVPHS